MILPVFAAAPLPDEPFFLCRISLFIGVAGNDHGRAVDDRIRMNIYLARIFQYTFRIFFLLP